LFPEVVVEGPADFGLALLVEDWRPHRSIPFIGGYVQAINHGHASRQLALGLNIDVVIAPVRPDAWIERDGHCHRIRHANTALSAMMMATASSDAVSVSMRDVRGTGLHNKIDIALLLRGSRQNQIYPVPLIHLSV
jgi:hypothetical protein